MRLIKSRLRALRQEDGYSMLAVIGAIVITTMLVSAAVAATNDDQTFLRRDINQKRAYAAAQTEGGISADRTAMARATRDLRYYSARRASAQLRELDPALDVLQFGGTVTFDREDGRRQTFRIVGEDEADPAQGSVSYVSPVARALLGKGVGETAMVAGGEVEILSID